MKSALPIASVAFQLVYVVALISTIYEITILFRADGLFESGDPRMMAGAISQAMIPLGLAAIVGLVGIFLAWLALRVKRVRPKWFVFLNKTLALTWLVFIPIGTIAGLALLWWNKSEANAHAAT